jgi:hypothetical protein
MKTYLGGLMVGAAVLLTGGLSGCASVRSPQAATVVSLKDQSQAGLSTSVYVADCPELAAFLVKRKFTLVHDRASAHFVADVVGTEKNGKWSFRVAQLRPANPAATRALTTALFEMTRGEAFDSERNAHAKPPSFVLLDALESSMRADSSR